MRLIDRLQNSSGPSPRLSLEIEPPELGAGIAGLLNYLDPLVAQGICHINITYHAEQIVGFAERDGRRFPVAKRKKPGTTGVAAALQMRYGEKGTCIVPHVVGRGFTPNTSEEYLVDLAYLGIRNVLAVAGDPLRFSDPQLAAVYRATPGFTSAAELIRQIFGLGHGTYVGAEEGECIDFCIGAACFPEPYAGTAWSSVIDNLKAKIDAGADYFVTQMFFANTAYFRLVELLRKNGITVPIVPGIKILTTQKQLESLPRVFSCSIPDELGHGLAGVSAADAAKVGLDWAVRQCAELTAFGAPLLHIFAARSAPVLELVRAVRG